MDRPEFSTFFLADRSWSQDTHQGCLYIAETQDVEAPLVGVLVPRASSQGERRKFGAIHVKKLCEGS